MKALLLLTGLLVLVAVLEVLEVSGEEHETCLLWKEMAHHLSSDNSSQMTCSSNNAHLCTSLDCQGTYKYKAWLLADQDEVEVDYCVGIWLHHCDNPISLEIYMEVPTLKVNYSERVKHEEMIPIPGMKFQLHGKGRAEGFLEFQMQRQGDNLTFGVIAKVKVTIIDRFVTWPQGLQKILVPPETIPVPPCHNATSSPPPPRPPCKSRPRPSTPFPPVPSTPHLDILRFPSMASKTYNKTCHGNASDCGQYEMCNLETWRCQCDQEFVFDKTRQACVTKNRLGQACNPMSGTGCGTNEECDPSLSLCQCQRGFAFSHMKQMCDYSPAHLAPGAGYIIPHPKKSAQKTAAVPGVIVGAIIGVVLAIAAVLAVFLFVRHLRRRDMHDRTILLMNDEAEIM